MYEINRVACTQSMLDHQPRSQSFEIGSAMGTSLPAYVLLLLSFFFFHQNGGFKRIPCGSLKKSVNAISVPFEVKVMLYFCIHGFASCKRRLCCLRGILSENSE